MRETGGFDGNLRWMRALPPALVTGLGLLIILILVLASAGGDPLALARLGTQYSQGDPGGSEGYDGQFVYYIAQDPAPDSVKGRLDVPAYRYQRILLPLTSRFLSLGNPEWIPWTIPLAGLVSQIIGTWLVGILLLGWGVSAWYALVYGLWAGFTLAVRLDLPEPLAYALVVGAILSSLRGRRWLTWILYGLAIFAKEVTAIFLAVQLIDYLGRRRWRDAVGLVTIGCLPFLLFQGWLWGAFGEVGLGSGGANATSFEAIPLLGFVKVAAADRTVFLVYLLVFGPFILFPTIWGLWQGMKNIRAHSLDLVALFLAANSLIILFLPFSTYREPGGLLRFCGGLVLAFLLYTASTKRTRLLNYSLFSMALNVFLIE
jgi:hypothetical protein